MPHHDFLNLAEVPGLEPDCLSQNQSAAYTTPQWALLYIAAAYVING